MSNFIRISETVAGKEEIAYFNSFIRSAKQGEKKLVDCPRCSGKGGFVQFAHVENGICFLCKGSKQTFSYNTDSQKYENKRLKEKIKELENGYWVSQSLIDEFCEIEEHQNPYFYKQLSWFYTKLKSENLPYGLILTDLSYRVNCHENFMYE